MLFTERSIFTMVHGIGLGGIFLLAFSGAFLLLWNLRSEDGLPAAVARRHGRYIAGITALMAVTLWLTVAVGTFVNFPGYRAVPPEGADLAEYPKALLKSNPDTDWLHSIGMELKEHVPWIPAMLMTAVAFVAWRYRVGIAGDAALRKTLMTSLVLIFGAVGVIAVLGIFINKVAPLV